MRVKTWKILDRGTVPEEARTFTFECPTCGREAELSAVGRAIAQAEGGGVVFDPGPQDLPKTIQCRKCGHVFTNRGGTHVG